MRALPFELYRAAQVRELDRIAIQERGIPGYTLMNRAGEAAFNLLRNRWPEARRIAVVCGSGNNAGDGYVVARLAQRAGLEVEVLTLADPDRLQGDEWLRFLDGKSGHAFAQGAGRWLLDGAYRPDIDARALAELEALARIRFLQLMQGRR